VTVSNYKNKKTMKITCGGWRPSILKCCDLGNRSDGWSGCSWSSKISRISSSIAVGSLLRTITGDVTSFMALVADLTSSVQWATIWCSAIPRNMPVLPTGVALHCLSLAVACEVVRPRALIARCWTRSTSKATTRLKPTETASPDTSTAASSRDRTSTGRIWAGTRKMAWLIAVVATATGAGSAKSQGRAIGLDMT
jgi:hypothetical protein